MARVEMEPGWEEEVLASWDEFGETRLGPDIATDARRYAPLGRSWIVDPAKHPRTADHEGGELKASIDHHMEDHTVIVDADAPYAAYVELGVRPHSIDAQGPWSLWSPVTNRYFGPHVNHPGFTARPYLRPALYQERGE